MRCVSRWAANLAVIALLAIVVGGVLAAFLVPGDPASKTAIGLGVLAAVIAAASFATSPVLDDIGRDVRRLREAAERATRTSPHPTIGSTGQQSGFWSRGGLIAATGIIAAGLLWHVLHRRSTGS